VTGLAVPGDRIFCDPQPVTTCDEGAPAKNSTFHDLKTQSFISPGCHEISNELLAGTTGATERTEGTVDLIATTLATEGAETSLLVLESAQMR
jgi:hypothetical protein